jgi:putative autoinducer-2 (AI-2) aldolase
MREENKMDWGIQNRLNRLIQKDRKALFLPIDHGYFQGPTRKLEKPGETIKPLIPYADAIMMTRGVLRNCVDPAIEKPVILRVSGGNSVVGDDLSNEEQLTSITEILRLNASAVSMSIYVGSKYEHQTLTSFSRLINQCEDVVIAGGPKVDTALEVFEFVYDGLQKGAIGVNLGRNIWQHQYPVAMIRAIRGVIHDNLTPEEAQELFEQVKAGKS